MYSSFGRRSSSGYLLHDDDIVVSVFPCGLLSSASGVID